MFNGYNETPLISYNEFSQERADKKQENVPKWSYGHDAGAQPAQIHPNNRHSEFWSGKSHFLGAPNLVKCNCTGCYTSSENQSYQGDANRHRPWLPRTFPVPLNGSSESCKLPGAYQWDNGLSNQSPCYTENGLQYVQENGGKYPKYPYYRHYQNSKLPEANQPGVITSVKDAEYAKKPKSDTPSRGLESPVQNAPRQTVFCNAAYNLTKRVDGRNYCNPNDKYSNLASCSVEQHIPRVPVVEPFLKTVPSNLSQNRVPSTGYRSVKENIPQPYIDSGYGDARKICSEPTSNGDKRNELFSTGQLQTGVHLDYPQFNRNLTEDEEQQKLYFDNTRHSEYYSIKRNHLILDNRKDCAMNQFTQMSMSEQQYNVSRSKYQDPGNFKSSFDAFYSKEYEKARPENHVPDNTACFQRIEEPKNENANVHSRLPRSALLFNDPGFADKSQNSFPYQSNPAAYRSHLRPEYSYPNVNAQVRFEYPTGFQRNDLNQYRVAPQQMQTCEQSIPQQESGLVYNHCQQNSNKAEEIRGPKNPSPVQTDFQGLESRKTNYLESIRSEEISKNGTSKISPLRLLRKKKFINVPHEPTPMNTLDSAPELDVRKFWSTWAEEEEEENVAPTQMVVLDCQNIDPEQVKLLNLYETDPVRAVHLDAGRIFLKGSNCSKEPNIQGYHVEESKTSEEAVAIEPKTDDRGNSNEKPATQQEKVEKAEESNPTPTSQPDINPSTFDSGCVLKSPSKNSKKVKCGQENREKKKPEVMDKWTEKKFDFLKRAEESKAAEVLRHEEEKKKIFETRMSLQQNFKKSQKVQEKNISGDEGVPERVSSFDENSQSNSPQGGNADAAHLPTSEYRRNKFLDYSDRKVVLNGTNEIERDAGQVIDDSTEDKINKMEENTRQECWEKWPEGRQAEKEFPSLNVKVKEETGGEIDDTLKKISDINFQSSGVMLENESESCTAKKWKPPTKKTKKKKSDHQTENDERTDKLTVETVSKPTIKFSIQKSHDLKISFKVLNSSKEYSDEDGGGEDAEAEGNAIEDSKNSTEMITLKYKSIQRDCDRKQSLDFVKNKRGFKKKKRGPEMKTPVLKIKKSRYMPQEELDPLANDDVYLNGSEKPYADEYATSDDFQVQETVDSAKIKLTFKRHNKGNFETEYKINSNNIDGISEFEPTPEEHSEMAKHKKKSKRAKKEEYFLEPGVDCFEEYPGPSTDAENGPETEKPLLESVLEEDSRKCSTVLGPGTDEENKDLKPSVLTFSEFPSDAQFPDPTFKSSPRDYEENRDAIEVSKSNKETDVCDEEQVEFNINHVINCDEDNGSEDNRDEFSPLPPRISAKESTPAEVASLEESQEKEVIQEISLDFIRSTKSPEIEINRRSGKTEQTNILLNVEGDDDTLKGNLDDIRDSKSLENSEEAGKSDEKGNESCDWNNVVVDGSIDDTFENVKERDSCSPVAPLPLLELENYNFNTSEKPYGISNEEETTVLPSEEVTMPGPVEDVNDPKENSPPDTELPGGTLEHLVEDLTSHDSALLGNDTSLTFDVPPEDILILSDDVKSSSGTEEKKNSDKDQKSLTQPEPEGTVHSAFDLPLEKPVQNLSKTDFVSDSRPSLEDATEMVESFFWKDSSRICESEVCRLFENSSPDISLKNSFSKSPMDSKGECTDFEFSTREDSCAVSPGETFDDVKPSSANSDSSNGQIEVDSRESEKEPVLDSCSLSFLEETTPSEVPSQEADDKHIDKTVNEQNDPSPSMDSSEVLTQSEERHSLELKCFDQTQEKDLEGSLVCETPSESQSVNKDIKSDIPPDVELEDGEIIDSSDEMEEKPHCEIIAGEALPHANLKKAEFINRKIERRHSTEPKQSRGESQKCELKTWSKRKFSKAKSCPPELKFPEGVLQEKEEIVHIPVEEIPLPLGPPPFDSCHNFKKNMSMRTQTESVFTEAKEKPKESISPKPPQVGQKEIPRLDSPSCCQSPFGQSDLQSCRNPSPPVFDKEASSRLGIFRRSSKIKFSFLRRSKFSKIDLKKFSSEKDSPETKAQEEPEKKEENNKEIRTPEPLPADLDSPPKECLVEEISSTKAAPTPPSCETEGIGVSEEVEKSLNDLEHPVELFCEDLEEGARVIDPMSDFMRDEFYECEDIPTSEDLTNGDDLENEKVNDDKFRNIMQNCLDNAKKFLNVGNLKLFSCSIDDLLELDCQAVESGPGEKPANHISRDVLLTSCEDTNDELGLSEDAAPPADISMDFVPLFCSDVCPEILPVDNWPYLEEEVASSPTRPKSDDADLIPSVECELSLTAPETLIQVCPKNGSDRPPRKRVFSESNYKSFRRRSLISDEEALRMCSKVGAQRRKTIEGFSEVSCGRDIRNIKCELAKLKNGTCEREKKSLKCRLSLEKLTSSHGISFELKKEKMVHENGRRVKSTKNLDYKSPSWQPKVMLFRISKNELRKIVGNSKTPRLLGPKNFRKPKKESSCEPKPSSEITPCFKKLKSETKPEDSCTKPDDGLRVPDGKLITLPQLDSIKGSFSPASSKDPEVQKRRKIRFRNLHSKRKSETEAPKKEDATVHSNRPGEPTPLEAEAALTRMFKDCNRNSNTKVMINGKDGNEKPKKSTDIKPVAEEDIQKASVRSEKTDRETEPSRSHDKFKESKEERHRDKSDKAHDHKDRRREKSEGREQRKHRDRHKEGEREKHARHDRSRHLDKRSSCGKSGERSRSVSGGSETRGKTQKASSPERPWTCEVCGFDDATERVVHIKSHPFHCQSCYLAFKTETHFIGHLTKNHKDIRNQHHCLLCELSFDTENQYYKHLETREHRHLESVEKNTINTLFTLLTGAPCPVLGLVEMKPEWLPNQSGTVHFYHQATPLSLALQYLKMHHDLSSFTTGSSIHPA